MQNIISQLIQDSVAAKQALLADNYLIDQVQLVVDVIVAQLNAGGTIYFCGNGGSAADAQHLSAEFTGRFYKERKALRSEALHCNTSYLTAVANDYGYDAVYERMIAGVGKPQDVLIALSTSGNSKNILNALVAAQQIGMPTVVLSGASGGKMAEHGDFKLLVPSSDTPRIQEAHILLGHIICQLVEERMA